jgi:HAD superfamily hydrolase (TIGR01549 family)
LIKAVIFDIDGTLVDSVDLHARAWQLAFRHFGYDIPFDEIRRQIGKGSDKLIPYFLPPKEVNHIGEELDRYRSRLWKTKFLRKVKPFPKVRELFLRIRSDGKRVALASSAKGDELEAYKKIANIADLVDEETSSDEVKRSKPDPDVIHAALRKLGNPKRAETIMVGDTPYDAKAAKKARVAPIGMLCGGFSEAELITAGCIAVYNHPADLLKHYDESPIAGKKPKPRKVLSRC